ncbi:MAG TPA: acetyl-CoA C-acetyltransferase [Vicinamibacteria bacterium]|nr:acetyl-CoA C-acetyltransferase [Vicinamibacteria bacterium]
MTKSIVIAGAVRTPIGKFGGALKTLSAADLGVAAARGALERSGVPANAVGEVIFGNARQAGVRPNVARQISYRAGFGESVPAYTINKACGSSLKAIMNAYAAVALGDADVVLAGGAESMSNTPYLLLDARWGQKLGSSEVVDGMYRDGFLCPLCGQLMGETAETLADRHRISREESDRYALESQHRCERARKEGRFLAEVVPVEVQGRKGQVDRISTDEHPRDGATLDSLQKLAPVFRKGGTVHAGNSSGITDGAAAVMVLSEEQAKGLGVEPMARIVGYASAGVDPAVMGIGPVPAVRKLLEKTGLRLEDIDLIELNEAFAAQVIACHRELGFDPERLNVNGGAIALGHPIGATGARIVVTLVHEMVRRKAQRGIATLCISGGMGLALLLESL